MFNRSFRYSSKQYLLKAVRHISWASWIFPWTSLMSLMACGSQRRQFFKGQCPSWKQLSNSLVRGIWLFAFWPFRDTLCRRASRSRTKLVVFHKSLLAPQERFSIRPTNFCFVPALETLFSSILESQMTHQRLLTAGFLGCFHRWACIFCEDIARIDLFPSWEFKKFLQEFKCRPTWSLTTHFGKVRLNLAPLFQKTSIRDSRD